MTDHYTCDECGGYLRTCGHRGTTAVTNAPPTPKLGPEHIEALVIGEKAMLDQTEMWENSAYSSEYEDHTEQSYARAETYKQRAARLAEIRVYLESLR